MRHCFTLLDFDTAHHHPYHDAIMLAECLGFTELLELAGQRAVRQLRFKPSNLPRLASLLEPTSVDDADDLQVQVSFVSSAEQFPEIEIAANGSLALVCQSCMQAVFWDLEIKVSLVVVANESALSKALDPFDCIIAGEKGVLLASVIEDEILASLPLSPMHPLGAEDCSVVYPSADTSDGDVHQRSAEAEEFRTRPFADLASMMGQSSGKHND